MTVRRYTMKYVTKAVLAVLIAVVLLLGATAYVVLREDNDTSVPTKTATNRPSGDSDAGAEPEGPTALSSTEDQLVFLLEEEKLAHDVYTVMYQKYGATVFGNILESESTHQGRVLTLLQARSIADPRSSTVGVFQNQALQTLYDQLIAQGNKSATEAYAVGVLIEEKDIADITTQLSTATDEDIIRTLEALRSGSENHLRAFNRKL